MPKIMLEFQINMPHNLEKLPYGTTCVKIFTFLDFYTINGFEASTIGLSQDTH
jgi:hypothetical protein